MLWFAILALAIWLGGWRAGVPAGLRWMLIALLWAAFTIAAAILPEAGGLRALFGGSAGEWWSVGLIVALVAIYRLALGRLRARARAGEAGAAPATGGGGSFTAGELDRYARHITLREIGGTGQRALKSAKVLVIGAGGLGAPVLQYLAAAGLGTIGVIDDDVVENSNLQRQVIHTDAHIGMPKVFSAQIALAALNPSVAVRPYHRRLDAETAAGLFGEYDLIIDGTDSFATRYMVNAAAHALGKPLVSGALSQWEGQVSLFGTGGDVPCYQCVFPAAPAPGLAPSCAEAGVLNALPGVIGAMMAAEAVKHLAGAGRTLAGRMLIYDALAAEVRVIGLRRRADCPICGADHAAASGAAR